jgi:hypothetical protein
MSTFSGAAKELFIEMQHLQFLIRKKSLIEGGQVLLQVLKTPDER